MDSTQLGQLQGELLAAGVAPRHARRIVGELRDHRSDLIEQLRDNGMGSGAAALEASARMGPTASVLEDVLARPELLSIARRRPAVVFMLIPAVAYVLIGAGAMFAVFTYVGNHFSAHPPDFTPAEQGLVSMALTFARVGIEWCLPMALVTYFMRLATLRGVRSPWLWLGVLLLAALGSLPQLTLELSAETRMLVGGVGIVDDWLHWLSWRALSVVIAALATYLYVSRRAKLLPARQSAGPRR